MPARELGWISLFASLAALRPLAPETSNLHLNLISSIGLGLRSINSNSIFVSISFVNEAKPAFLESDSHRC
jgi:hypothetical protein